MVDWGKNWFEKRDQVQVQVQGTEIEAFGIALSSRCGKSSEYQEMIAFAELLAEYSVDPLVSSVDYDSLNNIADIKLVCSVDKGPQPMWRLIEHLAAKTLTQFVLAYDPDDYVGDIRHGYDQYDSASDAARLEDITIMYEGMAKMMMESVLEEHRETKASRQAKADQI